MLENSTLNIDDVIFHGATLWRNFELFGDHKLAGYKCQEIMNDFKVIRRDPSFSRLRAMDAALIHKNTLDWLGRSLEQSSSAKNVVITHHAPSKKSLREKSKDHIVSAAYASDLEHFINTHKPDYWLHGHIHDSLDYPVSDCRVVCNPRGYTKGKRNAHFDPSLIIEL